MGTKLATSLHTSIHINTCTYTLEVKAVKFGVGGLSDHTWRRRRPSYAAHRITLFCSSWYLRLVREVQRDVVWRGA